MSDNDVEDEVKDERVAIFGNLEASSDNDNESDTSIPNIRRERWLLPESSNTPNVQLLRVCKAFHTEAEHIVYNYNHFQFRIKKYLDDFFTRCLHSTDRRLLIKSVSISLGVYNFTEADTRQAYEQGIPGPQDPMSTLIVHGRQFSNIGEAYCQLEKVPLDNGAWQKKVSSLTKHVKLDSLEIDVTCGSCGGGICSMAGNAIKAFKRGFAFGVPKSLVVSSWLAEATNPELIYLNAIARDCIKIWTLEKSGRISAGTEEFKDLEAAQRAYNGLTWLMVKARNEKVKMKVMKRITS